MYSNYFCLDADVEDNLESDTSRCFNNMTDSATTMDDSTIMEMIPEGSSASLESACKTESQTVFNVVYQAVPLEEPVQNGPVNNGVAEKDDNGEDVSVSFTLHDNGILQESTTETKSEVKAVYQLNGFNGTNNDSEGLEDFEFIDGPADEAETPKSSCATPKTPDKHMKTNETLANSTVENFTVIEKSSLPSNDVNVTVSIPIQQMNGPVMNGIGSSTDSEKLDSQKTAFSAKKDITNGLEEITEGVSSLKIHDKALVDLSNKTRKLTLGDNKHETTDIDKHKENANSTVFSQTSVTANDTKPILVKSECLQGERLHNADLNSGVISNSQGNTPSANPSVTQENTNIHENMNTHHIRSNSVHNHPSIGKHNRSWKEIQKEGQHKSVNTLRDRYHPNAGECSIESCLHQFTAAELLTGNNKFGCKNCTKLNHKHNPNKGKRNFFLYTLNILTPGPSCSNLRMLLVNISLKL